MASANCKVVLSCLLVVLATACLAAAESVQFTADGGASVCHETEKTCQKVESRPDALSFLMSDDEVKESSVDPLPIANATCALFYPNEAIATLKCPRCTWDDGDRCCATCRYYSRVPSVIWTKAGPCYTMSANGRYQYTLNGFCRNPRNYCGGSKSYRCQQQYGVHSVLCLKVNWPQISWSVERYRYPAYCSCRYSWTILHPADSALAPAS